MAALRAVDGSVLWKRQVSAATLIPACNITYGISSTPVLDRARGRLYAIGSDGLLHALSLATGEEIGGWPVRIVQLTGSEYVWSGLTLRGNRLYVPVASFCDKPDQDGYNADGRLVAVDVVDPRIVASLDITEGPNNMGGIWGYAGVTIDPDTGHLWTATGNGFVFDPECGFCLVETAGYAEAVLELDADLNVIAWNRPEDVAVVEDSGFGAAPLLFQPAGCPPLAAANAKNGRTYIWNRAALAAGPLWSARVGPGELGASFLAQPSYSPGWACSSSPPPATTTSRAQSAPSTPSSASRSGPAARSRNGRHGRRPASAAAPSRRRSSSATSCSSPAASTGTPLPSTPRPARCCGQ